MGNMIWVLHLSTWLPGSLRRDRSWQSGLGWVGRGSRDGIKGIGFHYLQDVWCWLGNANARGCHHYVFKHRLLTGRKEFEYGSRYETLSWMTAKQLALQTEGAWRCFWMMSSKHVKIWLCSYFVVYYICVFCVLCCEHHCCYCLVSFARM